MEYIRQIQLANEEIERKKKDRIEKRKQLREARQILDDPERGINPKKEEKSDQDGPETNRKLIASDEKQEDIGFDGKSSKKVSAPPES